MPRAIERLTHGGFPGDPVRLHLDEVEVQRPDSQARAIVTFTSRGGA
jgi:hypothetical protein